MSKLIDIPKNELKILIDRTLSERSLYEFFKLVMKNIYTNISFIDNWHYEQLCNILQQSVEKSLRAEPTIEHLLINLPIRSGKTMLISEILPIWIWIKSPKSAIMSVCATQRLATKSSRMSKLIIQSEWIQKLFPELILAQDNKSKADYSTTELGTRQSYGINSSIIGAGYDFLIIDDPNNPGDSNSDLALRNVTSTFEDVISGRMNNDSGLRIILQQRTSSSDLAGFLLKNNSQDYRHICITAKLNKVTSREFLQFYDDDDLFFPARYGKARLAKYVRDLSGQAYASQLDQLPSALEGTVILRNWFKIMKQSSFQKIKKNKNVLIVDGAYTDKEENDPTGFMICQEIGGKLYIIKAYSMHLEFYEQLDEIKEIIKSYNIKTVYVELKATGESIKQELKRQLRGACRVKGVNSGKESKTARAKSIQPQLIDGRVILVEDIWNEGFLSQCASFPYGSHDDLVDDLVYAVLILIAKKKITDTEEIKELNELPTEEFDLYGD